MTTNQSSDHQANPSNADSAPVLPATGSKAGLLNSISSFNKSTLNPTSTNDRSTPIL